MDKNGSRLNHGTLARVRRHRSGRREALWSFANRRDRQCPGFCSRRCPLVLGRSIARLGVWGLVWDPGIRLTPCLFRSASFFLVCWLVCAAAIGLAQEVVRLPATADVWLSDAIEQERNTNSGKCDRLKLKNIQEMALIRFDASAVRGREVLGAKLFLRRASDDRLRYIRVSTVNQDWEEGESRTPYGPPTGATFLYADARPDRRRAWAWPGSTLADVIMSSGNSLGCWAERQELPNRWICVPIMPELIYAMVAGDTDGLAVMDGGNPANHNNFVFSRESPGNEPYLEVQLGGKMEAVPAAPKLTAQPAPERAHLDTGAIRIAMEPAEHVFCWRVRLDGHRVERWRIKHPEPGQTTVFYLEDLVPDKEYELEVVAVSPGGQVSTPTTVRVRSSAALGRPIRLQPLRPPPAGPVAPWRAGRIQVWPLPGLVKINPLKPEVLCDDLGPADRPAPPNSLPNAVWDGKEVRLFGCRGEYVSFQLCIEKLQEQPVGQIRVRPGPLTGPKQFIIGGSEIVLFLIWYAKNRGQQWQPAYCIPIPHGATFEIPNRRRGMEGQQNQLVYVDLYIPKEAPAGLYQGEFLVETGMQERIPVPLRLEVFEFTLPDRLSFWPELNAYNLPPKPYDYYLLAHQHRCVLNCMGWPRPKLTGWGKTLQADWTEFDRRVGPLLTGELFAKSRRRGVPVECMYLPFGDDWPMPLNYKTYAYPGPWPKQGDDIQGIIDHYLKGPYIAQGLSQDYKDGFHAIQRQFIEHFRQRGYTQTEMQCFYGNKVTHRIHYGANMWWTTDEPYFWDDWLALQFFTRLWTVGRGDADRRLWVARADISRPQWQGSVLKGIVDVVYYGAGGFSTPAMVRRCRILSQETGLRLRSYGGAGPDDASGQQNVVALLSVWCDGAEAFLPWQTLGPDAALDEHDRALQGGGAALLVPGDRFRLPVVGDLRLKAFRDGQQLIEYLTLLCRQRGLVREQIKAMLWELVPLEGQMRGSVDNADAMQFGAISAWHLAHLRRQLAEMLAAPAKP